MGEIPGGQQPRSVLLRHALRVFGVEVVDEEPDRPEAELALRLANGVIGAGELHAIAAEQELDPDASDEIATAAERDADAAAGWPDPVPVAVLGWRAARVHTALARADQHGSDPVMAAARLASGVANSLLGLAEASHLAGLDPSWATTEPLEFRTATRQLVDRLDTSLRELGI